MKHTGGRKRGIIPEFKAELPKIPFRVKPIQFEIPKQIEEQLEVPVEVGKVKTVSRGKIALGCLIAVVLILIFQGIAVKAILTGILFAVCALSTIWKRKYPEFPVGVELFIFGTTIASISFGPVFGIFFGIFAVISAEVISGIIGEGIFFAMVAIALTAVIAHMLSDIHFVLLGLLLTLIFDLITQAVPLLSDTEARMKAIAFIATHLIFNFIVFKLLSPVSLFI